MQQHLSGQLLTLDLLRPPGCRAQQHPLEVLNPIRLLAWVERGDLGPIINDVQAGGAGGFAQRAA